MKTKAVRLYGVNDLRLEEFELPEIKDDEILAHIISDSVCMSTHKAAMQGAKHKRVPDDVAENPVIVGHEFCGEIVKVGKKWQNEFKEHEKFSIQPALGRADDPYSAPGYSFPYIGGDATYVVIPSVVMEQKCLLPFNGDAFFYGSLAEPVSCVIGGFHVNYHTTAGSYVHSMGIEEGGRCVILGGAGPMGLGAIDYAIHCDRKPSLLVATDINDERLARAASILSVEEAAKNGVKLVYLNTTLDNTKAIEMLMEVSGGKGYNDVYVYNPFESLLDQANAILCHDGCLNFFAGPTDPAFSARFNFYNVHYLLTHVAGNSGGNTDDMKEALSMMEKGLINPTSMITHIGGLDSAADAVIRLPEIKGGKKLVYTNISLPLTAISDFEKLGESDTLFKKLAEIVKANNGLWCAEAEKYLLANAKAI